MSIATDLAAESRAADNDDAPRPATTRVRFTETRERLVDLPTEEVDQLLDAELMDVAEEYTRIGRIAAGDHACLVADLDVEVDNSRGTWFGPQVIDGTAKPDYLASARHKVSEAVRELRAGRYRQRDTTGVDQLTKTLEQVDEQLRVMVLAAQGKDPYGRPLPDSGTA